MTFGSSYREVRKNECSRKRDFLGTVVRFNISLSQCRFFYRWSYGILLWEMATLGRLRS